MSIHRTMTGMVVAAMCCTLASTASHAQKLPSDEDVNGVMKICGGGREQSFDGEVRGRVELWKQGAVGTGKAKIADLSALLSKIKPDNPYSAKMYQTYVDCITSQISVYLQQKSNVDEDGYQLTRDGKRICKLERDPCVRIDGNPVAGTLGGVRCDYYGIPTVCLMGNGAWVRPGLTHEGL